MSKLDPGNNVPPSIETCPEKTIRTPGVFQLGNSRFYDDPFIDVVLSTAMGDYDLKAVKRINVVYQDDQYLDQIYIRTVPCD